MAGFGEPAGNSAAGRAGTDNGEIVARFSCSHSGPLEASAKRARTSDPEARLKSGRQGLRRVTVTRPPTGWNGVLVNIG